MRSFFVSLILLTGVAAQAQPAVKAASGAALQAPQAAAATSALPTRAQVDEAMRRSFGYDPAVTWEIYDIRSSEIPGFSEILVSMNKGEALRLFVTPDMKWAIVGQALPFGPNPFAPARAKLRAADGPHRGAASPVIDIVVFSDLECPHCKASEPILERIVNDFPQVRLTFQQFPLPADIHPWAKVAAEYADCAAHGGSGTEGFWKYVDAVFENQGSIAAATAHDKLRELATAMGLNAQQLAICVASPEAEARVKKSVELGKSLDVNQTPTVFINGRRVLGLANIPYEQLTNLINFEIAHAGK